MLLIRNGTARLNTGGRTQYKKTDILIEKNRIRQIGEHLSCPDADTLNASGMLVIPGLINCHIHSHDNFNKAWLDNMPLEIWMANVRPFFSGVRHTPEMVYHRTLLGAVEMLHSGVTSVMDDVLLNSPTDAECLDMVVKAYEDIGMRAVVLPHTKNIPMEKTIPYAEDLFTPEMKQAGCGPYPSEEKLLEFLEGSIKKYNHPGRRVTLGLSDSAPQRCTAKLMRGVRDLSVQYHVPVVCHVLETFVQKRTGEIFYGKSLVKYLAELGLLNENFVLIHCNWIDADDLALIKENGCKAVHNPACNMKMGSGIAPVYDMIRRVPAGLGTDNISANDSASLFEAMKLGALLSKIRTPEFRHWLRAEDMVRMATEFGSLCMNQEKEIGTLEEGKKADLALLRMDNEHYALSADYDNALVYSENGSSVDTVLVDGNIVLRDGHLTLLDEQTLFARLRELRPAILEEHRAALKECRGIADVFEQCYRRCNQPRL